MFMDYHVHTAFSDDSVYPMEEVVKDAVKMGMQELCFTDHVDYGIKKDWDCGEEIVYRDGEPMANVDYPKYMEEVKRVRALYPEISVKMGMEFGMQTHTIPEFQALYNRFLSVQPFDFIILSVHQVEDKEFWTQDFQRGRTPKEYNERYYEEMLALVRQYKDYSVLGHMDLIKRYGESLPFSEIRPMLAEILKTVIQDGKGIELNTSFHRYGLSDSMPSADILKLYHDLGGKIITIGSDSHKPEHLGAYFEEGCALLKEIGFKWICRYEKMQPVFEAL